MKKNEFNILLGNFLMEFSGMDQDNFLEAMPDIQESIERLNTALDKLLENKEKDKIRVVISGGAVQNVVFPEGMNDVELEIRDYDVDQDFESDFVKKDENGDTYQEMLFSE